MTMHEFIDIIFLLVVFKALIVGSDFSIEKWIKHKKKYTEWYFNRPTFIP